MHEETRITLIDVDRAKGWRYEFVMRSVGDQRILPNVDKACGNPEVFQRCVDECIGAHRIERIGHRDVAQFATNPESTVADALEAFGQLNRFQCVVVRKRLFLDGHG